jgi:hypothetical protein
MWRVVGVCSSGHYKTHYIARCDEWQPLRAECRGTKSSAECFEMKLTARQSYALLEKHGCYITEICEACGKGIGPVRFTRRGDSGVWCSGECRDGKERRQPATCRHCRAVLPKAKRRGAVFCDDACKQAAYRSKPVLQSPRKAKLSVTNKSIYAAFPSE